MANGDADTTDDGRGLRILIENSEYWLRNNGDLAMMEVTIARLRERWPAARIAVLTDTPALLRAYFPQAEAITVADENPWKSPTIVERIAVHAGPGRVGPPSIAWITTRILVPQKARGARRRLRRAWRELAGNPTPVSASAPRVPVTKGSFRAAEEASLLLVMGGGYLTDMDEYQARRVFNLAEHARRHGVPVAMVGQGIGPMDDPDLCALASANLPGVEFIALRERRRGPSILDRLGVPADRVLVTGDDAIELAYACREERIGNEIGLCLRVAGYSPVSSDIQETVGRVVQRAATERMAPLAPLVIAEYLRQDRRSTLPLVKGYESVRRPPGRFAHPADIAGRVASCRVMVTGAYHLAVFALSQGIPVVALTASEYYDDKFLGLGDMFEVGMAAVNLQTPDLEAVLQKAISDAWESAPAVRDRLRDRAQTQILDSRNGFERVYALPGRRHPAAR